MTYQRTEQPFLLPVTYWPQQSAMYWWDDFRREDVIRDFNLAFAAGASLLHVALPWKASQPYGERVSTSTMRDLETVMRIASDTGIRCVLSIAVTSVFDVLTLPPWFYELTADARAQPARVMRRLYEDPVVLGATATLFGELTREFGDHPNTAGWIAGDGLSTASPARSPDQVDRWLDQMRASLNLRGRRAWHGVSAHDLGGQRSVRLAAFSAAGLGILIHVDWKPAWAHDTRLWIAFLVSFVHGLGGLPPLVAGTARYPLPESSATEEAVNNLVAEVRSAGAAGLIWPALFDYDSQLRSRPPFTSAPGELSCGLLAAERGLSPAAAAWLGAVANPVSVATTSLLLLDEELRDRDPEGFMRLAYNDFIS